MQRIANFSRAVAHRNFDEGRPRGRSVDCRPSRSAVCAAQSSLPYGQPRRTHRRIASSSASVCGWLTCSHQSKGSANGQSHQQRLTLPAQAPVQTAPSPSLRTLAESGPQGITLHVPYHRVVVGVGFDRKGLEPALIQVAIANSLLGALPSLRVHIGHPLHELRQVAVPFWPENEVPVVR